MPLTKLNRPTLSIVYQAVDSLKPRSTNPRTHSKKQIGQIASRDPSVWLYQPRAGR